MNITAAEYTIEDNSSLKATLDDGKEWYMPQPCETWHNATLQEFLDGGGTISPYDPPSEPPEVQTLSQHAEVSDARLDALEAGIAAILRRLDALGSN